MEDLTTELEKLKNKSQMCQTFDDEKIEGYANLIFKGNLEKGFWPEKRNVKQIILLVLSEVSEALEEKRDGKEAVYYVEGKPEGWAIEIADAVIRALDAIGGVDRIDFESNDDPFMDVLYTGSDIAIRSFSVQGKQYQSLFSEDKTNFLMNFKSFVYYIEAGLRDLGDFNLIELINIKLKYNKTRAFKHGKNF